MSERRERIPASEVKDSKRWNLPFWTEPKHLVHNEEHAQDEQEEVLVEDEEIEVEPLTADQLESIRQEAFNEGLEQGLVEGRQKGEKLGHEDGYKEGLVQGKEEGRKLGFDSGFEQGEKQAFSNGSEENEKQSKKLQAILSSIETQITEQKTQLTDNLPDIILAIAKAVITQELSQGSEHIVKLVEQALNALPLDSGELKIEVNPQDLPFIEAAIEQGDFDGVAHATDNIEAGGCKVHTRYSSVDFTLSSRWADIEKQYRHQLQLSLNADDSEDDLPLNKDATAQDNQSTADTGLEIHDVPQDSAVHQPKRSGDEGAPLTEDQQSSKEQDKTSAQSDNADETVTSDEPSDDDAESGDDLQNVDGDDSISGDHATKGDSHEP
ncbi:MAG: hypothetical protein CL679_14145 [Bermanella sp.]|nr:hypothetical protein [Bermanella sp.]